jgi:heat shock protein HslJ
VGLLAIASLATACFGGGVVPASLDGRTFLSTEVSQDGAPRPLVPGTRIRIAFSAGRISASAGCNLLGGSYRLDGDRLIVDSLATTDMGCDPARHEQDAWLAAVLGGRPLVQLVGNDLSLQREGTLIKLLDRRIADPDQPLSGPTWRVESIVTGQTVSSVPAEVVASLTFAPDGRIAVETGCNSGGGTYTVDGRSILLSSIVLTKRACPGPAGDLEQAMVAVLQAESVSFTIEARALTLSAGERGLGLRAP